MWPWGHLAVGYLAYSLLARGTDRLDVTDGSAVGVALGTQFPDLVDKPFAWTLPLLPNGRSLAHSAFTATLVTAALYLAVRRASPDRRPVAGAFALGYWSHLFADALPSALAGEVDQLAFLLWPALPPVEYATGESFLAHLAGIEPTPYFLSQFVLVALAFAAWRRDGYPGLATVTFGRLEPAVDRSR